jgi:hypothetical protein
MLDPHTVPKQQAELELMVAFSETGTLGTVIIQGIQFPIKSRWFWHFKQSAERSARQNADTVKSLNRFPPMVN